MNQYIVLLICFITVHSENFIEDYCWRDYNGQMPRDALKCGKDKTGNPIYLGQVLYENKLIPGKIHYNDPKIHFEFRRAYTADESIKILCVRHPQRFEWIHVKLNEVSNTKHLFNGGFEKGFDTYVGRAKSHGELTVGKVVCSPIECYKLTTIENGTWYDHNEFEILAYNPNAKPYEDPFIADETKTFVPYLLLSLMIVFLLVILIITLRRC